MTLSQVYSQSLVDINGHKSGQSFGFYSMSSQVIIYLDSSEGLLIIYLGQENMKDDTCEPKKPISNSLKGICLKRGY